MNTDTNISLSDFILLIKTFLYVLHEQFRQQIKMNYSLKNSIREIHDFCIV